MKKREVRGSKKGGVGRGRKIREGGRKEERERGR